MMGTAERRRLVVPLTLLILFFAVGWTSGRSVATEERAAPARETTNESPSAGADEKEASSRAPRILFPGKRCIVESGRLELIALAQPQKDGLFAEVPLLVDGKPQEWGPYQPPVLVARLELTPGKHLLNVGGKDLVVFIAKAGKKGEDVRAGAGADPKDGRPEGWPAFRSHPGSKDGWKNCALCHGTEIDEGRMKVGRPKHYEVCRTCHTSEEFVRIHAHPEEPLFDCGMCHGVHGARRPSFLIASAKPLCALCHE